MSSIFAELVSLALSNQLQLYFIQIVFIHSQQVAQKLENQQKWIHIERSKKKKKKDSKIIDKKQLG